MAAPSPAGPAGPGVAVVPRAPPAAPSTPGGPPGASCLMRSGVASMICRASVTTSAWGRGTLGLSCPENVPNPGCSPPLPAGCRRAGPGHPQGGWGALPTPSSHPQRDLGGQGAAGRSQDPRRAPMGTTSCWLCSALGTGGTWQEGLVLERHTPRGRGDMQGMARGQGIPWGHTGDTKNLRRTENKGDMGIHREHRSGDKEHGERLWGTWVRRGAGGGRGTWGDTAGKGWRGPVTPWGHTKGDRGTAREYGDGDSGQKQRGGSDRGHTRVVVTGSCHRTVPTGHGDRGQGGHRVPGPYLCPGWQRAGRGCAGQAGDSAGTPGTPAAPPGG